MTTGRITKKTKRGEEEGKGEGFLMKKSRGMGGNRHLAEEKDWNATANDGEHNVTKNKRSAEPKTERSGPISNGPAKNRNAAH